MEKPEPKTLVTPSGKIQTNHLSIKKMMEPQAQVDSGIVTQTSDVLYESFSSDDLKIHWRRVAHQMKALGRETVYNALIKRDPLVVEGTNLTLEVDNPVQIELINCVKDDILAYLRSSLKNFSISLEMVVSTGEKATDVKLLNGADRFKYLAKKYPYLNRLKEMFGLDIDY